MADIADLTKNLQDHKDQLRQIEELLLTAPDDAELLKIKEDLEQVVALTEELAGGALGAEAGGDSGAKWKVGDRCTAKWEDGKYYSAVIQAVAEDDYTVMMLDYGNIKTMTESDMKPYVPLPKDQLIKGALVRAVWSDDGLFYDAVVIEELGNDQYAIKFPRFDKKKKVPVGAYDINPRFGHKTAINNANDPVPEEYVIPDSLRMKSSDTESQRRTKRARVKVNKQAHKRRKVEQEGQRKQNSWLAFQKSSKSGYGKKKKSMFATDTSGTVGVIGSGKGMTSNPDLIRNKYVEYEDEEEEA